MPANKQELIRRRCDKWLPHTPHVEVGEIKEPQWTPSDSPRLVIYHQCDGQGYGVEEWEEKRCLQKAAHWGHTWEPGLSSYTTKVWCTGQLLERQRIITADS